METDQLLSAVERENQAVGRLCVDVLDRTVPGCPGWDVAQLVRHLGAVHRWAGSIVRTAATTRPPRENTPTSPEDPAELRAWFDAGVVELVTTLRDADPDSRCWTWTGPQPPAWWIRRQAMEALVHRVDVEQAAGTAWPEVEPELALAGAEELLEVFAPYEKMPAELRESGRTLHLHATDRPGEWLLRLHAGGVEVTPGHARGDAALRGPVAGLFLWLWNRLPADRLEVIGDAEVPALWTRLTGR